MHILLTEEKRVVAALNEFELAKYGYDVKWFKDRKPFKEQLLIDIFAEATAKYNMKFDIDDCRLSIDSCLNTVIFSFSEKSNLIHLDNDYIQDEAVVNGIHRMFRELPDEQIDMGIIDVEEKKRRLQELRSDEGKELIREYFL